MQDYDKTTRFSGAANQTTSSLVTIFDGDIALRTIRLSEFGKNFIYFGRDPKAILYLLRILFLPNTDDSFIKTAHGSWKTKLHTKIPQVRMG